MQIEQNPLAGTGSRRQPFAGNPASGNRRDRHAFGKTERLASLVIRGTEILKRTSLLGHKARKQLTNDSKLLKTHFYTPSSGRRAMPQ